MRTIFALALVSAACSSEDPAASKTTPFGPPDAPGPYGVGVTTLETTSEGRTLPIEIWYPAATSETDTAVVYPLVLNGALHLADVPSPLGAVRDAPHDARGAPHPVVLFSHGNGGLRTQSVYLTEYLASHGFVVAAPDHVGNTIEEQVNGSSIAAAEAARLRPIDMSRTLDAVLAEIENADETRVGASGHSFGGFTTFRLAGATIDVDATIEHCKTTQSLFCDGWDQVQLPFPESARDERVIAALPQAPGGAEAIQGGFAAVTIPTMVQGGTTDDITDFEMESRGSYAALSGPAYLLGIEGAGHFTFSDVCQILELAALSIPDLQDGCEPGDIPWPDAHALINRYATAFFQVHLRGKTELSGELAAGAPLPAGVAVYEAR